MKKKLGAVILTGALVASMALTMTAATVSAGRGGAKGQSMQTPTRTMDPIRDRLQLRDGSCDDPAKRGAGTMEQNRNTYRQGDGKGNPGDRPMDGTGYGAPSQR